MNAKICSNCRESYDAYLNKCPKCGFGSETNDNSNSFNMRNPFLEMGSSSMPSNTQPSNSTFLNSEFNNNNSFLMESNVSNSVPTTNANIANTPVVTQSSSFGISSAPTQSNNNIEAPAPQTQYNNVMANVPSAPIENNDNAINTQNTLVQNNPANEEPKSKAFEPYVDNKKYEVSGIDFNSFFDTKQPEEKKENPKEASVISSNEELPTIVPVNNIQPTTTEKPNQELNVLNNGYNPSLDFEKNRLAVLREEENKKKMQLNESNKNSSSSKKNSEKIIDFYKFDFFFMSFITMAIFVLSCLTDFSIIILVHGVIEIGLMVVGYNLAFDRKEKAGYIGVIVSCLLIGNIAYGDYINVIIGALILVHSILYLLDFKKKKS
jgi:hypothetical protein